MEKPASKTGYMFGFTSKSAENSKDLISGTRGIMINLERSMPNLGPTVRSVSSCAAETRLSSIKIPDVNTLQVYLNVQFLKIGHFWLNDMDRVNIYMCMVNILDFEFSDETAIVRYEPHETGICH